MLCFVDCEFTDFKQMDLMSIGIVSEDGNHEFYQEVHHIADYRSTFVNQVVVPLMTVGSAKSHDHVALDLKEWLDALPGTDVTIVTDYVGDWYLMSDLLKKYPPSKRIFPKMYNAAFEYMLVERGFNPQSSTSKYSRALSAMTQGIADYFKIDPRQHHALVDAKANRHGWWKGYEAMK